MANTRARVFAFVLYPDNLEQMQLLDWLKEHWMNCKVMYILHQPESDEKKQHYHVMICFDNQRTPEGVRNYLGIVKTVWRLAKMSLNEEIKQKLVKDENAETETGYIRVEKTRDKEKFVLKNPDDPQSYIEVDYHDGDKVCREPLQDDEVWRLQPIYTVPHVEKVTDRNSYAAYMLHDTPQATRDGKRKYKISDLQGDIDFIESCFPVPKKECSANLIADAMQIAQNASSAQDFIKICYDSSRYDIIEYTASHSYFMERFVLPGFKKNGGASDGA